jgi:hypothetical protein
VTELRADMTKAIEGQIVQLAHVRGCRHVDAAIAVAQSFAENLRDSRGTSMESYWEEMVSIADGIAAADTGAWR